MNFLRQIKEYFFPTKHFPQVEESPWPFPAVDETPKKKRGRPRKATTTPKKKAK